MKAWEMRCKFESEMDGDSHMADDLIRSSVYDRVYNDIYIDQKIISVSSEFGVSFNQAQDLMVSLAIASINKLIAEIGPTLAAVLTPYFSGNNRWVVGKVLVNHHGLYVQLVDYA